MLASDFLARDAKVEENSRPEGEWDSDLQRVMISMAVCQQFCVFYRAGLLHMSSTSENMYYLSGKEIAQ